MLGVDILRSQVLLVVWGLVVLAQIWALVDAALRRPDAFVAAGKMTKTGWLIILGLSLVVTVLPLGMVLLQLAGTIAVIVYLVDVRPALRALRRRR